MKQINCFGWPRETAFCSANVWHDLSLSIVRGLLCLGYLVICCAHLASAQSASNVYVSDAFSNAITQYTLDPSTGALTQQGVVSTPEPIYMQATPSGKFLYAPNDTNPGSVSAFAINQTTGALTPVPGSPFATGSNPYAVTISPFGRYLYTSNSGSNTVSAFSIDANTGVLTPVANSPFAVGQTPYEVGIAPSEKFIYVANAGSDSISAFNVDPNTGALTSVPGSPFVDTGVSKDATGSGAYPGWVTVSPSGQFAYVANLHSWTIAVFSIDQITGALTPIPGSPFNAPASPQQVTFARSGQLAYITNSGTPFARTDGAISAFAVNTATGSMTPVAASPFPSGDATTYFALDPSGSFGYSTNYYDANVTGFSVNPATGALTKLSGSPFPTGANPRSVVIVGTSGTCTAGGQGPLAISSIYPASGGNTGPVTFSIRGCGLSAGSSVKLARSGQPDIIAQAVNVIVDGSLISVTFDLTSKTPGDWDVVATGANTLPGAFTIQNGGAAQLSLSIIGFDKIRVGRAQPYYIEYANQGTIDSTPGLVSVQVPSSIELAPGATSLLLGSMQTGGNSVATFYMPQLSPGTSGVVPIQLTVNGSSTALVGNAAAAVRTQQTLAQSSSVGSSTFLPTGFQLNAFLNQLLNLPPASLADFWSSVGCSPSLVCDRECASQYGRELSYESLAQSEFDSYASSSAQTTAAFALAGSKRALVVAEGVLVSGLIEDLVAAFGFASTIGEAGEALNYVTETALSELADVTQDAYSGKDPEAKQQLLNLGSSVGQMGLKLDTLVQNDPNDLKVGLIGRALDVIKSTVTDIGSDLDDYFQAQLEAQNAYNTFLVGAANYCRAVADNEQCVTRQGVTPCGTPPQPPPLPPPSSNQQTLTIQPVQSLDPNDKAGPVGIGQNQFISGRDPLTYSVFFANDDTATAPAQQVVVTDPINPKFVNMRSVALGSIQFGSTTIQPPPFSTSFQTSVDLRPMNNLIVNVSANLQQSSGILTWTFTSADPQTGQPPTDPSSGFLPPGVGGSVTFSVAPNSNIPDASTIQNSASIVFDRNAPIATQTWANTIDTLPPSSSVQALPATESTTTFPVTWTGSDAEAGIKEYTIWVSDNNSDLTSWLANTAATTAIFTGSSGHTYSFYSQATDLVGNVEPTKTNPDAVTTVATGACGTDVTSEVVISQGRFRRNGRTRLFVQKLTITNVGQRSLLMSSLIFDSLRRNVGVYNASGKTHCAMPSGSPYINIGDLAPGQTVNVTVQFKDLQRWQRHGRDDSAEGGDGAARLQPNERDEWREKEISYTPRILAGPGGR